MYIYICIYNIILTDEANAKYFISFNKYVFKTIHFSNTS